MLKYHGDSRLPLRGVREPPLLFLEPVAVIPFARPLEEKSYAFALRLAGLQSPISARAGGAHRVQSARSGCKSIGPSVGKRARRGRLSSFIHSQFSRRSGGAAFFSNLPLFPLLLCAYDG
jgi:hypothetical protein